MRLYRRASRTSWLNKMATYGDESVDSYFYSSYNPYAGRYHKPRDAGWKYNKYISHHADMIEAFNNTQRAQLRSILSQINPKLTPRLRKANTKDVAVQVNPKTDASVQCAIGPRTLLSVKRDALRRRTAQEGQGSPGSPKGAGGVRYPRTLAVYSPIAYRSITSFLSDDDKGTSCDVASGESLLEASGEAEAEAAKDENENISAETDEQKAAAQRKNIKSKQPLTPEASKSVKERSKLKARVRFQVRATRNDLYFIINE